MKNHGLSLIECLVVITILFILLLSTSLAYREFIQKNQLSSLVDNFMDALNYARNEAITLDTTITLCPKNSNNTCGLDWERGQFIMSKKENILRVLPAMPKQYHLLWRSTLGDSNYLQWRSDGFTRGQQGSFFICATDGTSAQIIILRTGRLRVIYGKINGCHQMI